MRLIRVLLATRLWQADGAGGTDREREGALTVKRGWVEKDAKTDAGNRQRGKQRVGRRGKVSWGCGLRVV